MRNGLGLERYRAGVLCALLLLSGSAEPAPAADAQPPPALSPAAESPAAKPSPAKPTTAIFIVAQDDVTDPIFGESVVLVMNNLGPAPVGIIVNRPTPVPVSHLFPKLKRLAQLPDKVYFGGPVEFESVWFLFRAATPPEHAVQACPGVYLSSDSQLLLQLLTRDKPMEGLRIFVGHAGWAPGQLQNEISRGFWTLKRAEPDAIFNGKSDHPWPPPQGPESPQGPQGPQGPKVST